MTIPMIWKQKGVHWGISYKQGGDERETPGKGQQASVREHIIMKADSLYGTEEKEEKSGFA